jgi:hypothetical protein
MGKRLGLSARRVALRNIEGPFGLGIWRDAWVSEQGGLPKEVWRAYRGIEGCQKRHGGPKRGGGPHMAKLLSLGASKGGDTSLCQQLSRDTVDCGRRYKEAGRQLQVSVVLHHAHKACLRTTTPHPVSIFVSQLFMSQLFLSQLSVDKLPQPSELASASEIVLQRNKTVLRSGLKWKNQQHMVVERVPRWNPGGSSGCGTMLWIEEPCCG